MQNNFCYHHDQCRMCELGIWSHIKNKEKKNNKKEFLQPCLINHTYTIGSKNLIQNLCYCQPEHENWDAPVLIVGASKGG